MEFKTQTIFITYDDFVKSRCFEIPESPFVFEPRYRNSFSVQGEEMVWQVLRVMPANGIAADQLLPPLEISEIVQKNFDDRRKDFFEKHPDFNEKKIENKLGTPFFAAHRIYVFLVPWLYKRTEAPRLSTTGNSFHGMKKDFLIQNLVVISAVHQNIFFLDIDLSAAHSRIARYLLHNEESSLHSSLKDPHFWDVQISNARPTYESYNVPIEDKVIKKI